MPSRDPLDLVGAAEIAEMLSVSRQRVSQLKNSPGFPAPALRLKMGSVWWTDDIRKWAAARGKPAP